MLTLPSDLPSERGAFAFKGPFALGTWGHLHTARAFVFFFFFLAGAEVARVAAGGPNRAWGTPGAPSPPPRTGREGEQRSAFRVELRLPPEDGMWRCPIAQLRPSAG